MNRLQNYKINPIRMLPLIMEQRYNIPRPLTIPPPLSKGDKTFFMQVPGIFLFCARAIDSTMLPDLSAIASEQNTLTENTMKRVKTFLDYAAYQE